MNKIGIVTINGDDNYGNRLQNYALEQSIIRLGFDVETVVFPKKKTLRDYVRHVVNCTKRNYRINQKTKKQMTKVKSKGFRLFRTEYLNNVEYNRKEDFSVFDRFITGSDQVWNPSWRLIDEYWLRFIPKNKRFSYAASMATTVVHKANENNLPKYLQEMNEISVREDESVPFIKKISGRNAKLVLDPTMLLEKEDYTQLIKKQKNSNVIKKTPYILVYSLVGVQEELQKEITKLSIEKGYRIVTVMGNQYNSEHKVFNPIEFVEAIQNAELVVSDSFHCGVFSLIMETPFILFDRVDGASMNSRILSLLRLFELEQQFYKSGEITPLLTIDFKKTKEILEEHRIESKKYLSFILNKKI